MMRSRLLLVALIVSLAFNVGFVGAVVIRCCGEELRSFVLPLEEIERPDGFDALGDRLEGELETLRLQQAGLTGRLADLITAPEPDPQEIDGCLDRLSTTGRQVQGLVVEAVLAQKDRLSETERESYCRRIHRSLCDPWVECGFRALSCAPNSDADAGTNDERSISR